MFGTDIYTLITSDASLNADTDGINFQNLPDNYLETGVTGNWIVYDYNITENGDCISENDVYRRYGIYVQVISSDTATRESLSEDVMDLLNGKSQGDIADIGFTNSDTLIDEEKEIYAILLTFTAIYFP